jgi:hypothetical protein
MSERIVFRNPEVLVTDKRVVVESETYSMRNITSVYVVTEEPGGAAVILIVFGLLGLFIAGGLFLLTVVLWLASSKGTEFGCCLVLSLIGLPTSAALAGLGLLLRWSSYTTYHIVFRTAGLETRVFSSTEEAFVDRIVAAINKAMTMT